MQGDIAQMPDMLRVTAGVDAILHLGGVSAEAGWEPILEANIVGCYNVFEAARRNGVKRVLFATSNHAVGFYRRDETIDHRVYPRPDSRYGLSKVFGEQVGSLYADKYGLQVLCLRIGNVSVKADRQAQAVDLAVAARPGAAGAHRRRPPRHPLRDRLRRVGQPALVVRQLERDAPRLSSAGRQRSRTPRRSSPSTWTTPTPTSSATRAERSSRWSRARRCTSRRSSARSGMEQVSRYHPLTPALSPQGRGRAHSESHSFQSTAALSSGSAGTRADR